MAKRFLTPTEQNSILRAYSMNFEREFYRMSPYCFGTDYGYTINLCPELDEEEKETGRILVNHYSADGVAKFVDVWEKEDKELRFKYRNLNSAQIRPVGEKDEHFRQSEEYRKLIIERDNLANEKKRAEKEVEKLKEKLRKTSEELLKVAKDPKRPVSPDVIYNARGAGRKKMSEEKIEELRNKISEMKGKGLKNSEIMKALGIGKTTFYRYCKE